MKHEEVYVVVLFGGLAIALLLMDRVFRIQPFLERQGFQSGGSEKPGSIKRCGVYGGVVQTGCPSGLRCINGLCMGENLPGIVEKHPLPVVP
jgi:hypothetical protein